MSDEQFDQTPDIQSPVEVSKDARTMAMLAHLLGAVTGFLGPLIIWIIKKDEDPFVADQSREALNFQITLFIGWIISSMLSMVCIGFFLMPILLVLQIVFAIIGGMKANEGVQYRYPFALRLIK